VQWVRSLLPEAQFKYFLRVAATAAIAVAALLVIVGSATGCASSRDFTVFVMGV
jgi:hypothetical protein